MSAASVTAVTDWWVTASYAGNIQVAGRQALPARQSSKGPRCEQQILSTLLW